MDMQPRDLEPRTTGYGHGIGMPASPAVQVTRTRLIPAMALGFVNRCPHCGEGRVFGHFLKARPECAVCGLPLGEHRADDLPPYLVIFLVGHIVGYLILTFELGYELPLWVSLTVWPALTLGLALALLQPVKGAVIGLQYAFAMHGFAKAPPPRPGTDPHPEDKPVGSAEPSRV